MKQKSFFCRQSEPIGINLLQRGRTKADIQQLCRVHEKASIKQRLFELDVFFKEVTFHALQKIHKTMSDPILPQCSQKNLRSNACELSDSKI